MSKQGPKILVPDIETLPLEVYNWSLFQEPRALDRIIKDKDWAIYSAAWKWSGEAKVGYVDTQHASDVRDDKEVVRETIAMLDEADIVVGQNVLRFDLPKIRARAIYHGFKPFREPQVVDTLLMAREIGRFTSNKLEYLSTLTDEVKSKHTKFPGFAMWLGILDNNPAAWAESKKYNKQDVRATDKLYLLLRPWARRHPNLAQYYDDEIMRCSRCGHDHLTYAGRIHRGVSTYESYKCDSCGGFNRSRFTLNSLEKRKSLLTSY